MSKEGLIAKVPSEQRRREVALLQAEPFQAEIKAKSRSPEWDLAWHSQEAVKHRHGRSQVVADELQEEAGPDGEAPGCTIWEDPTGC